MRSAIRQRVLVSGGASSIDAYLCRRLLARGEADVSCVAMTRSGSAGNRADCN